MEAVKLEADKEEACIVACEARACELHPIVVEADRREESLSVAIEVCEREFSIYSQGSAEFLLDECDTSIERLRLIMEDGEELLLEMLTKSDSVGKLLAQWWQRVTDCELLTLEGQDTRKSSRLNRTMKQFVVDLLALWKCEIASSFTQDLFSEEVIAFVESTERDPAYVAEFLKGIRANLQCAIARLYIDAHFMHSSNWLQRWRLRHRSRLVMQDSHGLSCFFEHVLTNGKQRGVVLFDWWRRLEKCQISLENTNEYEQSPETRSELELIVTEIEGEKSNRLLTQLISPNANVQNDIQRAVITELKAKVLIPMAAQELDSFWHSPHWIHWLRAKRANRIGENFNYDDSLFCVDFARSVCPQDTLSTCDPRTRMAIVSKSVHFIWNENEDIWKRAVRKHQEYIQMQRSIAASLAQTRIRSYLRQQQLKRLLLQAYYQALISAAVEIQRHFRGAYLGRYRLRKRLVARATQQVSEDALRAAVLNTATNFAREKIIANTLHNAVTAAFMHRHKDKPDPVTAARHIQRMARGWFSRIMFVRLKMRRFTALRSKRNLRIDTERLNARMKRLRDTRRRQQRDRVQKKIFEEEHAEARRAQEKAVELHRRRQQLPKAIDPDNKDLSLDLNQMAWCDEYQRKKDLAAQEALNALPEEAEQYIQPPKEIAPVVPWARVSDIAKIAKFSLAVPTRRKAKSSADDDSTSINYENGASSQHGATLPDKNNRLLGNKYNSDTHEKAVSLEALSRRYQIALHESLQVEDYEERSRLLEMTALKRAPTSLIKKHAKHQTRARKAGRIKLDRVQHDHQLAMVLHLRDAGLLR